MTVGISPSSNSFPQATQLLTCHTNKILEQSSLLHEVGAAITIKPNASRVLASWDFVPEQSSMVALRGMSLVDGTNMQTLVPTYYKDCESTWGLPMYAVHRVDLHTQLRRLATQAKGPGRPCDVRVLAKVVDYDAENGKVTTEDGEVLQAHLVIAADGVHSTAVKHVLGDDGIVQAGDTGWACMRWLVPRDEFLSDPETAHMIQDSATRYFTAAGGAAGLVWYPCRKCVVSRSLLHHNIVPSHKCLATCADCFGETLATNSRTSFTSRGNSTPPTLEKVRDEPVPVVQTDELY